VTVYVMVWEDRHIDDVISVHSTLKGAVGAMKDQMDAYTLHPGERWRKLKIAGWERNVYIDEDDGPFGRIERKELLP